MRTEYNSLCDSGHDEDGASKFTERDANGNVVSPGIFYYGLKGNSRLNALRASALSVVQQVLSSGLASKVGLIRFAGDVDFTDGFLDLTNKLVPLQQFINQMSAVNGTNSRIALLR